MEATNSKNADTLSSSAKVSNPNDTKIQNETTTTTSKTSPEFEANLFSRISYAWAKPLFRKASERHKANQGLEHEDLLPLAEADSGETIIQLFENAWNKQGPEKAKLSKTLYDVVKRRFVVAGFIKLLNSSLQFTFPLLLNSIL